MCSFHLQNLCTLSLEACGQRAHWAPNKQSQVNRSTPGPISCVNSAQISVWLIGPCHRTKLMSTIMYLLLISWQVISVTILTITKSSLLYSLHYSEFANLFWSTIKKLHHASSVEDQRQIWRCLLCCFEHLIAQGLTPRAERFAWNQPVINAKMQFSVWLCMMLRNKDVLHDQFVDSVLDVP